MQAVKGLFMEKWLCWGSMGVAGLLLLLFILDIPLGTVKSRLHAAVAHFADRWRSSNPTRSSGVAS